MKTKSKLTLITLLAGALCLFTTMTANAQSHKHNRGHRARTNTSVLQKQQAPTPITIRERTINDLLYFPYGCLSENIVNPDEAKTVLESTFGGYEIINGYIGFHINEAYDFSYKGEPIGLCYADWFDDRHWYEFYFDTHSEAQQFYTIITNEIKKAGIPLTKDTVYGGLSNRKHPVSVFKWVFVDTPALVKEADKSNIHRDDVVGKYYVEFGVYKRHAR